MSPTTFEAPPTWQISWLAQISQIIEEDAALLPVVPDRRFSFDVLLAATTVDQLLQAHELREVRPSVRQSGL